MDIIQLYESISNFFLPLNLIFAAVIIFRERKNPTSVWAWLMILLFLPVIGFVLYLFFGRDLKNSRWASQGRSRTRQFALEQTTRMQDTGEADIEGKEINKFQDLIYMQLASNDAPITDSNKLRTFTDGREKFDGLIKDLEAAEETIHMQYYIVRNDDLGQEIIQLLTRKAGEGVKVRFLYDGMGSFALNKNIFRPLKEQGGEVKAFFPAFSSLFRARLNHRNHRKIVVIDGKTAYTGGYNIGEEYLGKDKKFGYWRDTHLRIEGEAVHSFQDIFLMDWYKTTKEELEQDDSLFQASNTAGTIPMQVVASGADSRWDEVKNGFLKIINHAEDYIYIQTPYFIPDESILDSIRVAALSGIDVRIMIPNKPDHPFVYWSTYSYVGELMEAGVKIYIYENGFLHAKTIAVDDQMTTIGTTNVDVRSMSLNFEVNTFIYDRETTIGNKDIFFEDVEKSRELTMEEYRNSSLWIKFKESISRLISPLL